MLSKDEILDGIEVLKDELSEIKFWEEVYKKRGLKYKKKGGKSNAN